MTTPPSPITLRTWIKRLCVGSLFLGFCAFLWNRTVPLTTQSFVRPATPLVIHAVDRSDYLAVSGDYQTSTLRSAQRNDQHTHGEGFSFPPSLQQQLEQVVQTWCTDLLTIPPPPDPAYHVVFLCPDSQWNRHEIYFATNQVPPVLLEIDRQTPPLEP